MNPDARIPTPAHRMEAQREFTFDRAEKMRILRVADVPRTVAALIEAIEFAPPRPSWAILAAKMRCERTTVFRALRRAEALGVVAVVPHDSSNGRQEEHEYRIDWQMLATLEKVARKRPAPRRRNPLLFGGLQNATSPLQSATGQLHFATVRPLQNATPISYPLNSISPSPPPDSIGDTSSGCAVAVEGEDFYEPQETQAAEDQNGSRPQSTEPAMTTTLFDKPETPETLAIWRRAERRLVQCGVARARDAIEAARQAYWRPESVLAACEHFLAHRGAWQAGALYKRLRFTHPDTPVEQGWPPPSAEYLAEQRAEAEREAALARSRAVSAAERRRDRARAEHAELEARFGPRLDAMSREELENLVATIPGGELIAASPVVAWNRKAPLFRRDFLLPALAKLATSNPPDAP